MTAGRDLCFYIPHPLRAISRGIADLSILRASVYKLLYLSRAWYATWNRRFQLELVHCRRKGGQGTAAIVQHQIAWYGCRKYRMR